MIRTCMLRLLFEVEISFNHAPSIIIALDILSSWCYDDIKYKLKEEETFLDLNYRKLD